MNNNNKEITTASIPSRRKFVWGVGILSMFAAVAAATGLSFSSKKSIIACKPESKKRTVKMLTQDGSLVEVDELQITGSRKKIKNNELQNWIKK